MSGPLRSLVIPDFRPAARYLLDPERLPGEATGLVLVPDSDVGPILTHPSDTEIGGWLRVTKTWAPGEGRFMRQVLRPGMNVIDIGANIGYFTALSARAVGPGGRVVAVEADPETFAILRANVTLQAFQNVDLMPVAAHRTAQLVTVARDPANYGGHIAYQSHHGWSGTPMQAVRLDDVLDPEVPVDFVKVDVEGMDHAAVQGLERTVRSWGPTLLVEFNPEKIAWFGDEPADVLALYRRMDLRVAVLGWDALRLHRETGLDLEELVRQSLVIGPDQDQDIAERTRRIGLINLILTPNGATAPRAGRHR